MVLYVKQLPAEISEVDVIIAGGGTTACVVAARLSDAFPDMSILVIEGGQNNAGMPTVTYPAYFLAHLAPGSTANVFYKAKKSAALKDRDMFVPTGGILGGGSSTNFMMYSRALKSDFDSWNTPGWSAKDMMPYLNKTETYHGQDDKNVHGHHGPVHISRGTYTPNRLVEEFMTSTSKVGGWEEISDAQDMETVNGSGRAYRYISPGGLRQDAATCYLYPRLNRPNLTVLVETQVTRILFDDDGNANAVEVRGNPLFNNGENKDTNQGGQPATVKARKLVIAACGAIGTPALLERSGVGAPDILQKAGVPLVTASPGVGAGYLDHNMILYPYLNSLSPSDTLDALVYGRMGPPKDLIAAQNPMLGWNGQEVQLRVRPTDAEVDALGSASDVFKQAWDREFKEIPGKPVVVMTALAGFPLDPCLIPNPGDPGLAMSTFTVYPFSRGHVHITGSSLEDPLDFETGLLSDKDDIDLKMLVWTYKKQREVMRRMPCYRGEIATCHPPFDPTSPAACVSINKPLALPIDDTVYSAEDEAVLEEWIRANVGSGWHSSGTCKMLPREQGGVVDDKLSVYGVGRLKIADLSIVPRNIAANTNNTALAIGEKAADLFVEELLKG